MLWHCQYTIPPGVSLRPVHMYILEVLDRQEGLDPSLISNWHSFAGKAYTEGFFLYRSDDVGDLDKRLASYLPVLEWDCRPIHEVWPADRRLSYMRETVADHDTSVKWPDE